MGRSAKAVSPAPERARKPPGRLAGGSYALAYRPKDAAAVLGIGLSTIYRMIADGQIEAKKLGTSTIIRYEELVRVLDGAPLADATKAAQTSIR